jgi:hypothetical protein
MRISIILLIGVLALTGGASFAASPASTAKFQKPNLPKASGKNHPTPQQPKKPKSPGTSLNQEHAAPSP